VRVRGNQVDQEAVNLGIGGDVGIDARRTQKVECDFSLGEKLIP
jgi:hypothetical protein